jgi:hypothetical protein
MRRFANLYIVLFLVDAGLSLVDEILAAASAPVPLLSGGRHAVSYAVLALSIALYACLGIDRRLPKRVFFPMILYVSWCALAMWPLSGVVGRDALGLVAAAGQVLLGGIVVLLLRDPDGRVLLSPGQLRGPLLGWRNTLVFSAANLLLLPLVLVFTAMAVADDYLEEQTAGFLRLSPVGIYMAERSYHRDLKIVRLAGMMHIGKEDYYEELAGSMSSGGTIILTEGVTDRDRLLENPFNYSKLARVIGLTSQEAMRFDGRLVDLRDLGELQPGAGGPGKPDIARADIDLKNFDPQTIEFLNVLGNTLFSGKPLALALAEYNVWVKENMTPERIAVVMADILDKRNAVVIDSMVRTLKYYDTVIIPWGAMHMPAIEAAVLEQGFKPAVEQERLSLDFRTIPYAELWQKWSEASAGE